MGVIIYPYTGSDTPTATVTKKTLITVPPTPSVGKRTLSVVNTTDVIVTVEWDFLDEFGNSFDLLTFTIPAGNVTAQETILSDGGTVQASGSAPTVTAGAYANLVEHVSSGETIKYSATNPTTGSIQLDLTESEAE